MTDSHQPAHPQAEPDNACPDDRVIEGEPMTGAQRSYLKMLCEEARQPFDETLTKAQASRRIDELHRLTRRDAAPAVGRDVAANGRSRV